MTRWRRPCVLVGAAICLTLTAPACAGPAGNAAAPGGSEVSNEPGFEASGSTDIGGSAQECRDIRGRAVRTYKVLNLGDVGRAGIVGAMPIIVLDPELLRPLPAKLQIFFYLHECGHHALGHWMNFSVTHESEADCWAISRGRDRALFTRQEVVDFAPWLAASRGDAMGHPPGPERARRLVACFDEPPPSTIAGQ